MLATLLTIEDVILIKDTPVHDLFFGNKEAQINEAFYITQEGSFFSALTMFGVATYLWYRLFLQSCHEQIKREKVDACFAQHATNLSIPLSNALYRIKKVSTK